MFDGPFGLVRLIAAACLLIAAYVGVAAVFSTPGPGSYVECVRGTGYRDACRDTNWRAKISRPSE